MEDWVRARALRLPWRKPWQLGQLQFHWGKPPPAAEPSIRIFIGKGRGEEAAAVCTFGWRLRGARICVHFYGECRSLQAGKQLTE